MHAVVEKPIAPLNHSNCNYRMLVLLGRYSLYCMDNNHFLDVDLMLLDVVQCDCDI